MSRSASAELLVEHLRDPSDYDVVVVGAGFVGLEAATALVAGGWVTRGFGPPAEVPPRRSATAI